MTQIVRAITDDEDQWAADIRLALQKSVEGILESGRLLIEAKAGLSHGRFEIMVRDQLPFGARTARRLMAIASNPVLSNRTHASVLPTSWMTLYELSRLDPGELQIAVANHIIKPETQRKDLPGIIKRIRKALGKRVVNRRAPAKIRPFLADLRGAFDDELRAILDVLGSEQRETLIAEIVDLLQEKMADGKLPKREDGRPGPTDPR